MSNVDEYDDDDDDEETTNRQPRRRQLPVVPPVDKSSGSCRLPVTRNNDEQLSNSSSRENGNFGNFAVWAANRCANLLRRHSMKDSKGDVRDKELKREIGNAEFRREVGVKGEVGAKELKGDAGAKEFKEEVGNKEFKGDVGNKEFKGEVGDIHKDFKGKTGNSDKQLKEEDQQRREFKDNFQGSEFKNYSSSNDINNSDVSSQKVDLLNLGNRESTTGRNDKTIRRVRNSFSDNHINLIGLPRPIVVKGQTFSVRSQQRNGKPEGDIAANVHSAAAAAGENHHHHHHHSSSFLNNDNDSRRLSPVTIVNTANNNNNNRPNAELDLDVVEGSYFRPIKPASVNSTSSQFSRVGKQRLNIEKGSRRRNQAKLDAASAAAAAAEHDLSNSSSSSKGIICNNNYSSSSESCPEDVIFPPTLYNLLQTCTFVAVSLERSTPDDDCGLALSVVSFDGHRSSLTSSQPCGGHRQLAPPSLRKAIIAKHDIRGAFRPHVSDNGGYPCRKESTGSADLPSSCLVVVTDVKDDSTAGIDGQIAKGDYVIEINGAYVVNSSSEAVDNHLASRSDRLELVIARRSQSSRRRPTIIASSSRDNRDIFASEKLGKLSSSSRKEGERVLGPREDDRGEATSSSLHRDRWKIEKKIEQKKALRSKLTQSLDVGDSQLPYHFSSPFEDVVKVSEFQKQMPKDERQIIKESHLHHLHLSNENLQRTRYETKVSLQRRSTISSFNAKDPKIRSRQPMYEEYDYDVLRDEDSKRRNVSAV